MTIQLILIRHVKSILLFLIKGNGQIIKCLFLSIHFNRSFRVKIQRLICFNCSNSYKLIFLLIIVKSFNFISLKSKFAPFIIIDIKVQANILMFSYMLIYINSYINCINTKKRIKWAFDYGVIHPILTLLNSLYCSSINEMSSLNSLSPFIVSQMQLGL